MTMLVKQIHWIFILLGAWSAFESYEEKNQQIEQIKQSIPSIRNQISKVKLQIEKEKKYLEQRDTVQERVREVQKQIELTQKQLPTEVNATEVQQALSQIGQKIKFKDVEFNQGKEEEQGFYFTKQFKFQSRGTYLQSLIFLEQLEKQERILNVQSLKIMADTEERRSRFQVVSFETTIESYRYNPFSKGSTE